jgi:zinc-ribbon domain
VPAAGRPTFDCPNCGAAVRQGARSCPECGADDETGWSEDTMYDGLDLPDPGYGPETDGATGPARGGRISRVVALVLLIAIAAFVIAQAL